jgi:thiamine pyrophosphokinase
VPRALLFANGDPGDGPMPRRALATAFEAGPPLLVAADGGARTAASFGLLPAHVIGDMDSLDGDEQAALLAAGAQLHRYPPEKDETDLELALTFAVEHGVRWLRVLGAVGDRIDQTFSNITLLGLAALAGCDARLVSGRQAVWLAEAGEHAIDGEPGDTLSLLPLGGPAACITTHGLYYPLRGETLHVGPARGISNVLTSPRAHVAFTAGTLIVVHTLGRA